ncbi:MAG: efflux RND transporter periplasmic adaptor subunit [Planctomycetes bacterium]|nr:efflux RND transporter periplasmic adaptor subunit [Planctomycetota bacterium]
MSRRPAPRAVFFALLTSGLVPVLAHEGHKAIPTRGSSVEGDTVRLSADARAAVGLQVADVDSGTLESVVRVNADVALHPDRHAFASARLDGRIVAIAARPGTVVAAGDELARVESLDLDVLGIELIQSRTQLDYVLKDRERIVALVDKGLAAAKEQLDVETEWHSLEIGLDAARRRLLAVGLASEEIDAAIAEGKSPRTLPVRAPIGGVVIHADLEVGRFVESSDHLFELADLSRVWIVGEVPEDKSAQVRVGAEVRASFAAWPDRRFTGSVERRAPEIDRKTSTLRVYTVFDNPDFPDLALKPGLGGDLEIVVARAQDATVAPLAAVMIEGGAAFAFLEVSEGVYQKKELVLGIRTGDLVEVKDGLYPGDRVVTDGRHQLAGLFTLGVLRLSATARRNLGIQTAEANLQPVDGVVQTFGTARVQTGREFAASTRIQGKVLRVLVNVGDRVKAGDVLAEVESLELEGLEIDLRRERLRLDLAQAARGRVEGLAAQGIAAPRELLQAEREAWERMIELAGLRRRLEALGAAPEAIARVLESGETSPVFEIRTPIAGLVRARETVPGQVVGAGTTITEVAALAPLWIEAAVPQEAIGRVQAAAPARFRSAAFGERSFEGRIAATLPVLDEATRTLPVQVEAGNEDGLLLPGMRFEVAIIVSAATEVLAVPRAAVGSDGGRPYAVVENPDGTFRQVALELGLGDDRYVEVVQGLDPGDRVAVQGVEALRSALASVR